MSRRTDHLERLCNKLERRYGRTDSLFVQAKTELETYKADTAQMNPLGHDWSKSYSAFIKRCTMDSQSKSRH